jgi:cytosine/adenosine deaminase-related metal-dependent hydrolase
VSGRKVLLDGAVVVTMDPPARVLRRGAILISDGWIRSVGESPLEGEGAERVDLSGCVVLPGLVQAHVHLGQTFFRGLAEGRRLLPWLRERIWPLEAAHDDDSAYWSALLGAAECLLGGTTTVQEIGLGPGAAGLLEGILESGLRGLAGMCLMDEGENLPPSLLSTTEVALRRTADLGRDLERRSDGRLRYSLNPRFILCASDDLWRGVRELSLDSGWPVHTHALEQAEETERVRSLKRGRDEIDYFDDEGLLDGDVRIAHGVQLDARHLPELARRRFSVAHCPSANLRLGSGVADVVGLRGAGIPVGVGADGAACNNDLDCLEEVRLAAMLQQLRHGPEGFDGRTALRLATSEGARALGLEREIGSIEPGKRADLLVLDAGGPEWSAAEACDVHDLVVFGATRASVRHVMIDGVWRVWERSLCGLDLARIRRRADEERGRLLARSGLGL